MGQNLTILNSPTWSDFAAVALATARSCGLGYWNDEVAGEYARSVEGRRTGAPGQAITAIRKLSAELGLMPPASAVADEMRRSSPQSESVSSHGWRLKVAGRLRVIPRNCNVLKMGYRPSSGDELLDEHGKRLLHWSECAEGREFKALWDSLSGKRRNSSYASGVSGVCG